MFLVYFVWLIGKNIQDRIDWITQGGNFRVVLVDEEGRFENWDHAHAVVLVRPNVIFNYLRLQHKIGSVLKNTVLGPCPLDENYEKDFAVPLGLVSETLLKNARRLTSSEALAAEVYSEAVSDDVANVRTLSDSTETNFVALTSQTLDALVDPMELLASVETMLHASDSLVPQDDDAEEDDEISTDEDAEKDNKTIEKDSKTRMKLPAANTSPYMYAVINKFK